MRASASSAQAGRSARCRALRAAPQTRPLPPADSRRRARRRRRLAARVGERVAAHRLDRIGVAHQHDRRRRVSRVRNSRDEFEHIAQAHAVPSARSDARWITGPSAIGSENGTPSSMMSAPASTSACISGTVTRQRGIARGDERDQRLAACGCAAPRSVSSMRCQVEALPRSLIVSPDRTRADSRN